MATRPKAEHVPQYRNEAARGNAAKLIIDNPVFSEITRDLQAALLKSWLHTDPKDVMSREWFHQQYLALQSIINAINKAVTTGEMANMSLKEIDPPAPPTRRRRSNG